MNILRWHVVDSSSKSGIQYTRMYIDVQDFTNEQIENEYNKFVCWLSCNDKYKDILSMQGNNVHLTIRKPILKDSISNDIHISTDAEYILEAYNIFKSMLKEFNDHILDSQ